MVVDQDKGVGGMADHGFKNFARVSKALVQRSFGNLADGDQPKTGVQQDYPKGLAIKPTHLASE